MVCRFGQRFSKMQIALRVNTQRRIYCLRTPLESGSFLLQRVNNKNKGFM